MTSINAYLAFAGNCREAMNFYQSCLGGELSIMPYEGSPMEVPEEEKQLVMHATLSNNGSILMASDAMGEHAPVPGSTVSLSVNCSSVEEIEDYFVKMSEGGKVTMPLQDTFWGARFGMLTDKFGMDWMFNCEMVKTDTNEAVLAGSDAEEE